MTAASFVDTNVLLYADDIHAPAKRERAESLIKQITDARSGCLSMQVLQEYFAVATQKLGLSAEFARERVERYVRFDVVILKPADLLAAIALHQRYQFSIWDALIVRAALISGCETLYSEDFQNGQRIEKLTIVNPF
ncbi:MAG TPA: PIN domain-containing protein [Thermoanaerobaculia bacterium]|nr:PIN domain-containing protein [Thermoanaerobaculia bacterium]